MNIEGSIDEEWLCWAACSWQGNAWRCARRIPADESQAVHFDDRETFYGCSLNRSGHRSLRDGMSAQAMSSVALPMTTRVSHDSFSFLATDGQREGNTAWRGVFWLLPDLASVIGAGSIKIVPAALRSRLWQATRAIGEKASR
jgi:hypothetical protein